MSSKDRMHWLTLRFLDAGCEAGFLKFRTPKLIRNLRHGAVISFVSITVTIIYSKKWDFSPDQHSTKEHNATMQLVNIMGCVHLCIATAFFLFSLFAHRFQPVVVEIVIVSGMGVSMLLYSLSTPNFVGRILKHDTTAYLSAYELTDTEVLLGLDAIITATHILLPVRFRFMLVLQVIGFLSYVLPVAFLGTPYPETISRSVLFYLMLIALSGVGLHSLEREQRFSFVSLIHERSLRYQSDFQLAAFNGNDRQHHISEAARSIASRATSEASTTLFGIAGLMSEELVAQGLREQWLIKEHEVTLSDGVVLGQGGFGVVLGARFFGADVAVKLPKPNLDGHEITSTLESCCRELRVLRHLRHPNIVSLYGALIQTRGVKFALVLELIAGGTFKQFMEGALEREDLSCLSSELLRVSVLKQIAAALRYLHSREPPVIHGDLKHTNVFVDQRGDHAVHVKLLDFGFSRLVKRSSRSRPLGGTWRWVAPEVFLQHNELPGSLTATDVFSLGCVMFYASTGQKPFQHITSRPSRQFHCSALLDWPVEEADRFLPVVIRDFTDQCTQLNALRRPSVNDVYSNLARIENQFSHQLAPQLSACEQPVWTCAGPSSGSQPPPPESSTDEWALPEASATGGISSCDARAAGAGRRIPEGDGVLPETVGRLQSGRLQEEQEETA